ncbi:LOW QUALITY PROTEIN: cbl-associated protein [Aphomia sociella]
MPDRPKRRKNNKNKRKGKTQRTDNNKNCGDVKDVDHSEICNADTPSLTENTNSSQSKENDTLNTDEVQKTTHVDEAQTVESSTSTSFCQDLNNNSNNLPVLPSVPMDSDVQDSDIYVVESPEETIKNKPKLSSNIKSKSLDNDDAPQIIEITDDNSNPSEEVNVIAVIESNNVIVSEVESDVEWEKTDELKEDSPSYSTEFATGTLSIATIPLNIAQCGQTKSLTPEEEKSLRHYLQTLNLSSKSDINSLEIKTEIEQIINREVRHRLRKKGLADDFIIQRHGPPRILDVIDEEGSGESSFSSRRQSYLSDKKSDNEDLDDDVFEENKTNEKYSTKAVKQAIGKRFGALVPQQCILVGAKIKEPEVSEARGDWVVKTLEEMTGAEVVYLTDSSSSTSSIHEIGEETDGSADTDVSVRIITPTIEVTDTEELLKKSFLNNNEEKIESDKNKKELIIDTDVTKTTKAAAEDNKDQVLQNPHEIVILSTENIKTDLYVKDLEQPKDEKIFEIIDNSSNKSVNTVSENTDQTTTNIQSSSDNYNLELKVLKCELNDAINNLIKEVSSDSEISTETSKDNITRQDSSSSVCSSQCTAKYNPSHSSLNDISNTLHDDNMCNNTESNTEIIQKSDVNSHVKDVFQCVTGTSTLKQDKSHIFEQPLALRDICVKKIAAFPYGDKILEELASVSKRLQNINIHGNSITEQCKLNKEDHKLSRMPYFPLPDISNIEKVSVPVKFRDSVPPPLLPRNSSLKKSQDESLWTASPSKNESLYVCLSPSQKMLMERTNTVITKENATDLIDTHKKFIDRRGYNEFYKENKIGNVNEYNEPSVVPFKSQTGSRLLALIRDPSVSCNINAPMNKNSNKNLDHQQTYRVINSKNSYENIDSFRNISNTFKPIPPPRPKKYSSSFYESDESSDFTDNSFRSMKSERKFFHYSTGNLSKEIENDVSSIQNMHRHFTNIRDHINQTNCPRRPSLPKDLCDQQMEYIRRKEKEVEAEIRRLENEKINAPEIPKRGPRAPLIRDQEEIIKKDSHFIKKNVEHNTQQDKGDNRRLRSLFSSSQEELLRDKMYSEYVSQMAQRQERKQHKVIKITNSGTELNSKSVSKSMPALDLLNSKVNNRIEKEFISKARERWNKLGIKDPETEDEREDRNNIYREPKVIEHKIKVIEGGKETDVQDLPNHLQDFVRFTSKDKIEGKSSSETVMIAPTFKARSSSPAVWRPGAPTPTPAPTQSAERSPGAPPPPPPPPVWTPGSAGPSPLAARKTFRPVHFEETPPARRKFENTDQNGCTSGSESEGRLRTSQSAPATGLNTLGGTSFSSRLPRAQNPTVTLLQKAREGQIPRGASYLQQERDGARLPRDRPSPPIGDPIHVLRQGYASEGEGERSDYERGARKMADVPRKVEGIGPTTKDGMPVALRSEVKDQSRWYKKMYDTIHKNKYDDDYVTIRYKNRRGQAPQRVSNKSQYAYFDPRSGYLSEPEGGLSRLGSSTWSDAYDSDVTTGPRRRTASVQEDRRFDDATSPYLPNNKYSTLASARASQEVYKNQPGRIENYMPGRSSVIDKEAKQWWDEVMDIFDGWLDDNSPLPPYTTLLARAIQKSQNISSTTSLPQASPKDKKDITSAILSKSNMARALKESGYESDSTLVFRRREETDAPLSPAEKRAAYKDLQAGGEPPLRGFRSPAPPRQDESEIEYIPISPTLTKIRVHKNTPKVHEVICYPITRIETNLQAKLKKELPVIGNVNIPRDRITEFPPAPPRRVSSRNSRTLQLVTSTRPVSTSPKRSSSQANVNFLKDKISNKLSRQNTQILSKRESIKHSKTNSEIKLTKDRVMSTSAPPAVNRKSNLVSSSGTSVKKTNNVKPTSSFSSPRKTLLPIEYSNSMHSKYGNSQTSIIIEGGAGRRTPISNILDKVTSLDKLWSSEKRNERIDPTKVKPKSNVKSNVNITTKSNIIKPIALSTSKSLTSGVTHRSRDMIRTAEKIQKLRMSNLHAKSDICLLIKHDNKSMKSSNLQSTSDVSKYPSKHMSAKKTNQIKSAVVTNLKNKKPLESVIIRPRSTPCHESCSKKIKDAKNIKGKVAKGKSTKTSVLKSSIDSESESQFGDTSHELSNFGSFEHLDNKRISSKEIKKTRDAVISDSFFQHLFLGSSCMPTAVYPVIEPNTTVLEKAKIFQSSPKDSKEPKSLNTYLIHRKPVSLSRFKMWDRYPSPSRTQSPRSISWPGRMHSEIRKFDSLSKGSEFGSNSSIATVRSKSEPPVNKFYFSQTSRPKSPTVLFYKKEKPKTSQLNSSISPSRLFFSQTARPVSPKVIHKVPKISHSTPISCRPQSPTKIIFTETTRPISPQVTKGVDSDIVNINESLEKYPTTLFFSHTSRPVSPKIVKKDFIKYSSRSRSTSPISIRSPSYRRIHSAKLQNSKFYGDNTNLLRTRSAGDADKKVPQQAMKLKTKSETNLHSDDPDYQEYIRDMENTKVRSERFRELNRYYTYLERVGELEKATSRSELRHRRKDEEIIDFDRWKKIRAIERAEEELNNLYFKLKRAQNESDVLFYPRDLKDFRWNHDRDRGLRTKEKSVEDLKEHFQQLTYSEQDLDQTPSKDTYKPLWRGTSVAETAFNINRKNDIDKKESVSSNKPTITLHQDSTLSDLRKKIGLGNRLWSSLSMEQVNALKSQLNAIYSKELEAKTNKDLDKFSIDVEPKDMEKPTLHIRCNSLITCQNTLQEENKKNLSKSESIAAISCPITSVKELKNNVNKIQMSLSERKRKISQTLSKEILDRVSKFDNVVPLSLQEEMENNKTKDKLILESNDNIFDNTIHSDITKESINSDKSNDKRHIIFPKEKLDLQYQSPLSETDTASSDISNKTVIYKGPSKEAKKVEYFESVSTTSDQSKTIYHARESSDENSEKNKMSTPKLQNAQKTEPQKNLIIQSQSCTNFKELFGESEINKFLSLPTKPEIYSRSSSPHSDVHVTGRKTPDTLRYSSNETIWRSRSPSPDPERYWRAYLNLARAGEVRRLARRFDSPNAAGAVLRRHRSDPEIARNILHNNWSSVEKSLRSERNILPVARVPLRPANRFMPHIDIISKLAALRRRTTPRSRSAEETSECRAGEVDRIRRRFETMSLLGQIYASAPDMSELRDIAPYLTGPWVAHRYPKSSDNNRSIKNPKILVCGRTSPIKKDIKKSIPKNSVKLSSILKSDSFERQEFNPSVHRPASRYEPPRAPPRPPPAAWPYRVAPYITPSRHTVTFQEFDSAPEPPRRAPHGSYSDTGTIPRRYVESDVNIHYRCPVRHDPLPLVPERELARQQAEHMKRLYREQKRNKYLQENEIHPLDIEAFDASIKELQDMQNRRHQDNFTPSQKNILPLNRYDEAEKIIARALYAFNGQTSRELSFRKGDLINVRRQIDANWYEGEVHGRIGLFPYNYVEIMKGEVAQSPKKPVALEGRARAKFDFIAQTNLELPLKKGEVVVLTRRIDQNWWEGRNGNRTGIFPDSYVTILQEPSANKPEPQIISSTDKPVASPAAHGLLNGTAKRSMGSHSYLPQPNSPALSNAPPATQPLPGYVAKPAQVTQTPSERGYGPPSGAGVDLNNTEPLYVDTNAEAVPYRAMYKYRPQNPDELELNEGDTVYVLEKCDDGWYVGSSQRTGRFGTFPGNYVERI